MHKLTLTLGLALTVLAADLSAGALSNRRAPGFSLPDVSLNQRDLRDYEGKFVIVNLMQTTCPHCSDFSRILYRAEKMYKGKLQVVGIAKYPPETQQTIRSYQEKNAISQLILFDCGQATASYMKLGPSNPNFDVPHFFLIDQKGWIVEDYGYNQLNTGIFEGEDLFRILEKYLGKPATAAVKPGGAVESGF